MQGISHVGPWINTETKKLIRKKNRWLHKAKTTKSDKVWKIYRKIKSVTQRTCRQTHENYLKTLFENDRSNKKLWSYIKNRKQQNVGIPEIKDQNKTQTSDPVKRANLIRQKFDSVFPIPSVFLKFFSGNLADMYKSSSKYPCTRKFFQQTGNLRTSSPIKKRKQIPPQKLQTHTLDITHVQNFRTCVQPFYVPF